MRDNTKYFGIDKLTFNGVVWLLGKCYLLAGGELDEISVLGLQKWN